MPKRTLFARAENRAADPYTHGCVAPAFADALAALEQLQPGDEIVIE